MAAPVGGYRVIARAMRSLRLANSLALRGLNEIVRVPGAAIPGALAPTIFMLGSYSIFGGLDVLPGFGDAQYLDFVLPVGILQGAAFTGAATGVNLARDIEAGWFDRVMLSPTPRPAILLGIVASAALRALLPVSVLLAVGFMLGLHWPGFAGLLLAFLLAAGLAAALAAWSSTLALKFRSQDAAPLMQSTGFILVFFTAAYAPQALLAPWLQTVTKLNPATYVLEAVRQAFVGSISWSTTWPGLVALAGLLAAASALALRGIDRTNR